MNDLIDTFIDIERRLANDHGGFALFALFLREDAQDKWDLVAAAPWLDPDSQDSLATLVSAVKPRLTSDQLTRLSRIVIVGMDNPALKAINASMRIEHGQTEVRDSSFFGLLIKHAWIITSQNSPSPTGLAATVS